MGAMPRYLWQQAVIRWMDESEKRSLNSDKSIFRWLRPYLDDVYLDEIDETLIEKIIKAKLKEVSKTRVNRVTGLIKAVLNKAMKHWKWINSVPSIRQFKETGRRLRWLTPDEAIKLMGLLKPHTKDMMVFTLATGLRESNVTHLEWSQIDMTKKIAWIHADQSKNGKVIKVPLNQDAINVLRANLGKHQTRVFTYKGNPINKAGTKQWRMALKKAGIENFTWHGLRHTWASWHVQAGTPLNVLQELGGWSDYKMVLRYGHLAPEHINQFANNLDSIVAKSVAGENVTILKIS